MKKSVCFIVLLSLFLCYVQPISAARRNIVTQWAPVIYQVDRSDGLTAQQNIFTLVNFDRDWRLNNNWYNLRFYSLERVMYYSLMESDTYYFIGYYQYYPRHIGSDEHEHDMTGVLLAVKKTSDGGGRLDMLVTYSNHKWQKWEREQVLLEDGNPVLTISAATHEIAARGKSNRVLLTDGIHIITTNENLIKAGDNKVLQRSHAGYRLVPLTQLWEHCQEIGQGLVFARWGYFDSYNAVKATAPWVWNYHQNNWLTKPGELIQCLKGIPVKSIPYRSNPYQNQLK